MKNSKSKRIVNKPLNRQKLIQATLDTIVESGIENASVSHILKKANLSRGMINLHFDGKEALLLEALKLYTDIYNQSFYSKLDDMVAASAASKLQAIIEHDLDTCVLNRDYVVIWYEFRGKARTNEMYRQYTDTRYKRFRKTYYSICKELVKKEMLSDVSAKAIAHGLITMIEGMWIDFYLHSDSFNRIAAKKTFLIYLAALFPKQFSHKGVIN